MSESKFFRDLAASFMKKHSEEDGWSILGDNWGWDACIELLPAFLRENATAVIQREAIWSWSGWVSEHALRRDSLKERPHRRRGQGISDRDWCGEIDFIWDGCPIHYSRQLLLGDSNEKRVTFAATKERDALERLWRALRNYRKQHSLFRSSIEMVDGGFIRRAEANWNDLILPGTMSEDIRRSVESFLRAKAKYKELKLPYRRGFLFTGTPGCGKTLTLRIIASRVKAAVFSLSLKAKTDDGDLYRAFKMARESAPSVLIFEDLDRIADSNEVSLSYLLNLLDGLVANEGVLILATTNHPEKLDSALLHRPSRFDKIWHFPLPGFEERLALIRKRSAGKFSEPAIEDAARQSQGFTMAYVQEAVVNAFLEALYEDRSARDLDLTASVRKLKEQFSSNFKANGAVEALKGVGFGAVA